MFPAMRFLIPKLKINNYRDTVGTIVALPFVDIAELVTMEKNEG